MSFELTPGAFQTEAQAIAAIEAAGMHAYAADVEANERGLHWHDFDSMTAIIDGELVVTDEAGAALTCGPGSMLTVTDRPIHTERSPAGRFVFGFTVSFEQLERPINRDPATHPNR